MSTLKEFHETEQALNVQLAKLEALKNNPLLKDALVFEKKLAALMNQYETYPEEMLNLLQNATSNALNAVHESKAEYGLIVPERTRAGRTTTRGGRKKDAGQAT